MSAMAHPTGLRRGLVLTGAGSLASLVFLFLETIIAARLLSTDAYGSYVLLLATVNFLVMAIDFGCKTAVTQLIASGNRARQEAAARFTDIRYWSEPARGGHFPALEQPAEFAAEIAAFFDLVR